MTGAEKEGGETANLASTPPPFSAEMEDIMEAFRLSVRFTTQLKGSRPSVGTNTHQQGETGQQSSLLTKNSSSIHFQLVLACCEGGTGLAVCGRGVCTKTCLAALG